MGRGGSEADDFGVEEAVEVLRRHGVIGDEPMSQQPLRTDPGSANCVVALHGAAGPTLVVKVDDPAALSPVARFHAAYGQLPLVPSMRFVDPAARFVAYDWVPGELGRDLSPPPDKATTLHAVADTLISHYVAADDSDGPGRLYSPWLRADLRPRTWQQFLSRAMRARRDQVHAHLPATAAPLVRELAASPDRQGDGPLFLMHGDCGAHNFVFRDGRLTGVIDPAPIIGEPIFELAFAFASWPADLTFDAIRPAAETLEHAGRWRPPHGERDRVLIEEVLIALYSRVGTFVVNRPADVPAYVDAWNDWTGLLSSRRPSTR